jgi:hypothetical protein
MEHNFSICRVDEKESDFAHANYYDGGPCRLQETAQAIA